MARGSTVRLQGDWNGLARMMTTVSSRSMWRMASSRAMGREAHRLHGIIVKGFNSQGPKGVKWKKLARMTIALRRAVHGRRGTKALMLSGDMRASVKVVQEGEDWFVGVHRSEKGKGGKSMVDIASVHEMGSKKPIRIKVTPRMRAFFMAMFLKTTTPAHRKRMARSKRSGKPGRGRMPKYAILPLAKSTKVIVVRIPARPFIGPVWEAEKDKSAANIINGTLASMGMGKYVKGLRR